MAVDMEKLDALLERRRAHRVHEEYVLRHCEEFPAWRGDISQKQLAEVCGVPLPYISRVERRDFGFGRDALARIVEVYQKLQEIHEGADRGADPS